MDNAGQANGHQMIQTLLKNLRKIGAHRPKLVAENSVLRDVLQVHVFQKKKFTCENRRKWLLYRNSELLSRAKKFDRNLQKLTQKISFCAQKVHRLEQVLLAAPCNFFSDHRVFPGSKNVFCGDVLQVGPGVLRLDLGSVAGSAA